MVKTMGHTYQLKKELTVCINTITAYLDHFYITITTTAAIIITAAVAAAVASFLSN
jgi:hypothetical protein